MKEDIENTSDSSKETRSVFIGAKVTLTQKEHIKSLAGQCGMTVSDYILSRAYNFKPKARLTKEEAALLQNLDDCRSDLIKYTSALHGMSTKQRMAMFNQIPFMVGWLKELGNVAENVCQFLNAVKEKIKFCLTQTPKKNDCESQSHIARYKRHPLHYRRITAQKIIRRRFIGYWTTCCPQNRTLWGYGTPCS